jgi:5'(3')-deoxyribonucleotidase
MPGAVDMVKKAHEITGNKPNILTAPVGNENDPNNPSVKEKREWVSRHFGDLINKMEVTIDKGKYANSENDILIDDRVKYVDKFTNGGGSAILFKEPASAMKELEDLYNSLTS